MTKKARERLFLNEVAALYSDFPPGTIIDCERPDFLITGTSGVTGIEIVDYVRGQVKRESVYRRDEMLWQRIADAARAEFETLHTEPLWVLFFWNSDKHPRSSETRQLALEAASVVAKHVPKSLSGKISLDSYRLRKTSLSSYCYRISVTRMRDEIQALWSSVSAGFISVQVDEIQHLITSKGAKVEDYLSKCDTVWLLIVADGFHISSNVSLREVENHTFKSQFNHVLFYDRIENEVKHISTE